MNISTDILRLSGTAPVVPGLSIAFNLAMLIIQTVQISKRNTARLQYLAHLVADSLVSIAENMQGRWDDVLPALKTKLDEFEAILQDVLKMVKRHTSSSPLLALFNAGDRDLNITMLEKRLSDARSSILLLLGVDASAALQNIARTVNSMYSAMMDMHLEGINRQLFQTMPESGDDPDIRTYTREDLLVLHTISHYQVSLRQHPKSDRVTSITVKLHKAQRYDNRIFLVKTYHDVKSTGKAEFERDVNSRRHILDPSVLQLVGASRATASIPFQVYQMPGGHFETFGTWAERTLSSDPIETIYGLYNMRRSVMALAELQESQKLFLPSDTDNLTRSLFVNVQPGHDRHQWRLIYAGELGGEGNREKHKTDVHFEVSACLPRNSNQGRDPVSLMGYMMLLTSAWTQTTEGLVDINLPCSYDEISLPMLGAAFFEQGWVIPSSFYIRLTDTVGLGDVGYMNEAGGFVVVDNVHSLMQAESGTLSWGERIDITRDGEDLEDILAEEIVSRAGKVYQRRRLPTLTIPESVDIWITLEYENLDEADAWHLLQHQAYSIIADHDLPIAPHELRIVIEKISWWKTDLRVTDDPPDSKYRGVFQRESHINPKTTDSGHSAVYIFTNNEIPNVQTSGAPEPTTKIRASFDAEPSWLDDATRHDRDGYPSDGAERVEGYTSSEVQYGLCLDLNKQDPLIRSLQLPIGAAHPTISEIEEHL